MPDIDVEELSARLHEIYQKEMHRRHADNYDDLPGEVKELDRIFAHWTEIPPP